jgi:hypothetical protein
MQTKVDFTLVRVAVGIFIYLAMLGAVAIAAYVLWAGPESLGVSESWPLVFYFVVPFLGTMLVGSGIITAIRVGPGLVRRML